MSWVERINTGLEITTGDGRKFTPQWLNANKSVEYNVAEFDFPDVSGTLVKRGTPKGRRFTLQMYFNGDDNIDQAEAFEVSSADPRAWTISHPFYGRLIVQPVSIEFDNTRYNVSEVRAEVMETITEDYPKSSVIPEEKIEQDVAAVNAVSSEQTALEITADGIAASSITKQRQFLVDINANVAQIISSLDGVDAYYNAFNEATSAVNSIASAPALAITATQGIITTPARFESSVRSRMSILGDSFGALTSSLVNVLRMDKVLYEANGTAIMTAMCLTVSTPIDDDYGNRGDTLEIVDELLSYYDSFIETLDGLQTATGGTPQSYIPNAESMTELAQLVGYTVSNLFSIALDAKQERSVVLEKDSNWVILAHRFYGLKADDSTIEELIRNNNAGLSEMLQVKKNRVVTYYL